MIKLIDFKTGFDRVIQMALRDIDMRNLSEAMLGWNEEEREIIYRNMSKRAAALLAEEIEESEGQVPSMKIEASQQFYLQKLQQHLKYYSRDNDEAKKLLAEIHQRKTESGVQLPEIDLSSDEMLTKSFVGLSRFIRKHGILALAGVEDSVDHPLMKKALEYILDGWDPIFFQSILERMSAEYIRKVKRQHEMIITGIASIAAGDQPVGVEEQLRAFLV